MTDFCVYTITHRQSGACYVGMTGRGAAHRWGQHKSAARKGKRSLLSDALRADGVEAFDWRVVAEYPSSELAEAAERQLVIDLKPSLNTYAGGRSGYQLPQPVRDKLTAAALQREPLSAEARAKISAAARGRRPSAETRAKMSEAHRGRRPTPETRDKLSAAQRGNTKMLGKRRSPETRAKIAAAMQGNTNRRKGLHA